MTNEKIRLRDFIADDDGWLMPYQITITMNG